MNLHSPQFEKTLRRGVRKAVRSSRELKRQYRAARFRKQYGLALIARPCLSLLLAAIVFQFAEQTGHPASGLAIISLWSALFIFVHAQALLTRLYAAPDLRALAFLSVPEPIVFQWELQQFVRKTFWSLLDLVAAYVALGLYTDLSAAQWIAALPIAVLSWVEVLALAALAVAYFPRFPYQLISTGAFGIIFVLFVARDFVDKPLVAFMDQVAPSLLLLLPTGWPVSVFHALRPGGDWMLLLLLLPVGGLIWTIRNSLARLQANYEFIEPVVPEAPDLIPGAETSPSVQPDVAQSGGQRVGPTEIEDIVMTRAFLVSPGQQPGWFQNLFWSWLSEREKALVEFVFPSGFAIDAWWKKLFRNFAIIVLLTYVANLYRSTLVFWVAGIGLFVTGCQALAQILSTGRAFETMKSAGLNIPMYAGYAIGFRELGRLLFKYSLVQMPFMVLFTVLCSVLLAYVSEVSLPVAAVFGLKLGGLIYFSRFIFVTFAFSSGTNDSTAGLFRTTAILIFILFFGLSFVGMSVASLLVPHWGLAWGLWALAGLDAYAFFLTYGWFYHANRFDLMCVPKQ